jgi:hypothetical protein
VHPAPHDSGRCIKQPDASKTDIAAAAMRAPPDTANADAAAAAVHALPTGAQTSLEPLPPAKKGQVGVVRGWQASATAWPARRMSLSSPAAISGLCARSIEPGHGRSPLGVSQELQLVACGECRGALPRRAMALELRRANTWSRSILGWAGCRNEVNP